MKTRVFVLLNLVLVTALFVSGGVASTAAQSQPADPRKATTALQSTPQMFIENVGQFDESVLYQLHGSDSTLWLARDALWITALEPFALTADHSPYEGKISRRPLSSLADSGTGFERKSKPRGVALKLSFVGVNPTPRLEPFGELDSRVSYFLGSDPDQWRADVPVWGGVRYVGLYPGIDLELHGIDEAVAWRLVCRAADCQSALRRVRLRVEGTDTIAVDGDRLRLTTALGDYTLPLLQVVGADVTSLARPTITGDQVAWPFASPGRSPQSTVQDLQSGALLYGTFLGGSGNDSGNAIAVDEAGSAYVTGRTRSSATTFPITPGAFDTTYNGGSDGDAFVIKLNADATGLAYGTFLGGSSNDVGYGIAVDGAGNAYVTGYTGSATTFPTTTLAFDTTYNGGSFDAFVVKLNADGTDLVYSTFLGGSSSDVSNAIAVDGAGNAYVTGRTTSSTTFPTTTAAFDTTYNGSYDAFAVKLNAAGTGLAYATFLGGGNSDEGEGIAVDGADNAYIVGGTFSSDFPTTPGAFDTSHNDNDEAFVVKLNAGGTALSYGTFVGGGGFDRGYGIAVDGVDSAYITGDTSSDDFPTTPEAYDRSFNGIYDAFVVKVNAGGTALAYATFLGGNNRELGVSIAVDETGSAYVTGDTSSSGFPTTPGAFDTGYSGGDYFKRDGFVAKMNAGGTELAYSTFLGRGGDDWGKSIAVDGAGGAYVTGYTGSSNFPTTEGAFDEVFNGDTYDAFVVKFRLRLFQIYLPAVLKGYTP